MNGRHMFFFLHRTVLDSTAPPHRSLADTLSFHYAFIQIFFWAASGTLYAFLTVFLTARGFSVSQIGYINSIRIGSAVVGSLFFAYIGDRFQRIPIKYIFSIMSGVAILINLFLQFTNPGFLGMTVIFILFGLTECSVSTILDSIALQFINHGVPIRYSVCRGAGSFSYALVCLFLGALTDSLGANVIVYFHGVFLVLAVISALTFRTFSRSEFPEPVHSTRPVQESSFSALWKGNPQYVFLLLANGILCFGYWPASSFLANVMESVGGNNSILGIAMFVCAACELPMMAFIYPRLSKKVSPQKLLFVSILVHFFRWTGLIFVASPWAIVALQAMQMFSFGLSLPASVDYINRHVAEENRIKGQTLYSMSSNIGGTLGNSVFGIILERTSITGMLAASSAVIFIGVILMFFMMRSKEGAVQENAGNI